jgi:hypothetical protein
MKISIFNAGEIADNIVTITSPLSERVDNRSIPIALVILVAGSVTPLVRLRDDSTFGRIIELTLFQNGIS